MELSYWESRWRKGKIGFHADWVNPYLKIYWPQIPASDEQNVLVPLCGKNVDMLWLRERGHHVWGVEYVDLACESFFRENNIYYDIDHFGQWKIYEGDNIHIIQGDFFKLPTNLLPPVRAVYDRGALVALPGEKRQKYTESIKRVISPGCSMLVHAFEYDQEKMSGPPFSVPCLEVESYYPDSYNYQVDCLGKSEKIDHLAKFRQRGLTSIIEKAYHIRRNIS